MCIPFPAAAPRQAGEVPSAAMLPVDRRSIAASCSATFVFRLNCRVGVGEVSRLRSVAVARRDAEMTRRVRAQNWVTSCGTRDA